MGKDTTQGMIDQIRQGTERLSRTRLMKIADRLETLDAENRELRRRLNRVLEISAEHNSLEKQRQHVEEHRRARD